MGKKTLNLNIPELLCLPSDPQEMGTETFLQDFSKEKTKKNCYNSIFTKIYIVSITSKIHIKYGKIWTSRLYKNRLLINGYQATSPSLTTTIKLYPLEMLNFPSNKSPSFKKFRKSERMVMWFI